MAFGSTIGSLFVRLGLDIPGFQKDTRRAKRLTKQFRNQWQRDFKAMNRSVLSLGRSFGVLAGGAAIAGEMKAITNAGVSMQKMLNTLNVATGDASSSMGFLRAEAERLGLDLETSAESFSKIAAAARGTALEGEEVRRIFTAVSTASTAMGLSADQTQGALRALEQMISKGNVQAEELRGQLGERLPGAFQLAAKAMGVTTQALNKMLDNGEVLAAELLPKLADVLIEDFGEGAQTASGQAQAQFNRLSTSIFELNAAIAESGVLGVIADMADGLTKAAKSAALFIKLFDDSAPERVAARYGEISDRMAWITARLEKMKGDIIPEVLERGTIRDLNNEYKELSKELVKVQAAMTNIKSGTLAPPPMIPEDEIGGKDKKAQEKLAKLQAAWKIHSQEMAILRDVAFADETTQALAHEQMRADRDVRAADAKATALIEAGANRIQVLTELHDIRASLEEQSFERIIDIKQQEADEIERIQDESIKKQLMLDRQLSNARMGLAKGFFGAFAAMMNTGNRRLFEIGKAAAIAQTVVSTYSSAQKAYESQLSIPSPDAPARAALAAGIAVAAGLSRVAAISSTSFGSRGAGTVAGGGTPNIGGGGNIAQPPAPREDQLQPITIQVINTGNGTEFIDTEVIPQIQDRVLNADVQIIDNRSRNAQDLIGAVA